MEDYQVIVGEERICYAKIYPCQSTALLDITCPL